MRYLSIWKRFASLGLQPLMTWTPRSGHSTTEVSRKFASNSANSQTSSKRTRSRDKEQTMLKYLWLRIGDNDEYNQYGDDLDAVASILNECNIDPNTMFKIDCGFVAKGYTNA